MGKRSSAATMPTERPAGEAPEVNLGNPLHADNKAHQGGIHPGYQTQGRRHQKCKQEHPWAHGKDLCPI